MKKIISLVLAAVMLTSVAAIPTQAATDPFADKVAGRIPQDAWTAREVPEGTVVTVPPFKSDDPNIQTALIRGGSMDYPGGWIEELQDSFSWWDGGGETNPQWQPWTLNTEVKLEGKSSACVDVSPAMADLSGQNPARLPFMGFTGVFIEPCFDNQVYHLRFYVKAEKELGFENPQIMVYLLDTDASDGDSFETTVGTKNVMLDASNIDYHWYDQNEIAFEEGQNPTGTYKQGYGPFYQGKWIQIDSYFVTPLDFKEGAYSIQLHTNTGADCKLFFDAFSLEKITMDQVDMGVALKSAGNTKASVKFVKKNVKIKKGKKVTLKVKLSGAKKATFSVDKKGKKVVKLSKKKAKSVVVTGKKKGKATITAKAAGKKATCKVTVK